MDGGGRWTRPRVAPRSRRRCGSTRSRRGCWPGGGSPIPTPPSAFLAARLAGPARPVHDEGHGRGGGAASSGPLEAGERIACYGDYDVDGVTSTVAPLRLPPRRRRRRRHLHAAPAGRGVRPEHARRSRKLAAQGSRLLVTLDCGITSVEEVRAAAALGVDTVVVDHHTVPVELPAARAILNPHQPGCAYPSKELAAVGVTFALAMALRRTLRERGRFGAGARRAEPEGRARPRGARHRRGRGAARRREPDPRPLGARGDRQEPAAGLARAEGRGRDRRGGRGHRGPGRVPARPAHQRRGQARRRRARGAAAARRRRGEPHARWRRSSTARTGAAGDRAADPRRGDRGRARAGRRGRPRHRPRARRVARGRGRDRRVADRGAFSPARRADRPGGRLRGRGAAAQSRRSTSTTRSPPARATSPASAVTGMRPGSRSSARGSRAFRAAFEGHAARAARARKTWCRAAGSTAGSRSGT